MITKEWLSFWRFLLHILAFIIYAFIGTVGIILFIPSLGWSIPLAKKIIIAIQTPLNYIYGAHD